MLSLAALIALWAVTAALVQSRLLPGPLAVGAVTLAEIRSGELPFQLGCTLARVVGSFAIAMLLGAVTGYAMGRSKAFDRYADPWLIVLINLPALVTIIFAYIWIGLNETAAILAVAINKLPNVTVVMREGTRALDPELEEMAKAFQFTGLSRLRNVVIPQLAPYLAASSRSGLSIVWKIVLVVELLGRPNGVGFELHLNFQLFNVTAILGYTLAFVAVMLAIEYLLVQPIERYSTRWRNKPV